MRRASARTALSLALPALSLTLLVCAPVGCVGGSTPYPPAATGAADMSVPRRDGGVDVPSSDLGPAADSGGLTDTDGGFFEHADGAAVDAAITDADVSDAEVSDAAVSDAEVSDAEVSDAEVSDAEVSDAEVSDAEVSDAEVSDAEVSDAEIVDAASDADVSDADAHARRGAP